MDFPREHRPEREGRDFVPGPSADEPTGFRKAAARPEAPIRWPVSPLAKGSGEEYRLQEVAGEVPAWAKLPDVEGPFGRFFDRAARTALWAVGEHLVNGVLPGAGVLVRIAYHVVRYAAAAASLNDGRGADFQVELAGSGPLSLAFSIRLGAQDDLARPRIAVFPDLNFMSGQEADAVAVEHTPLVVSRPEDPFVWVLDLFGPAAVRDHAAVLDLARWLSAGEVEEMLDRLADGGVDVAFTVDPATGAGAIHLVREVRVGPSRPS